MKILIKDILAAQDSWHKLMAMELPIKVAWRLKYFGVAINQTIQNYRELADKITEDMSTLRKPPDDPQGESIWMVSPANVKEHRARIQELQKQEVELPERKIRISDFLSGLGEDFTISPAIFADLYFIFEEEETI